MCVLVQGLSASRSIPCPPLPHLALLMSGCQLASGFSQWERSWKEKAVYFSSHLYASGGGSGPCHVSPTAPFLHSLGDPHPWASIACSFCPFSLRVTVTAFSCHTLVCFMTPCLASQLFHLLCSPFSLCFKYSEWCVLSLLVPDKRKSQEKG